MEVVADELRPKTTPSEPANPDPNPKLREEGELSSADEHEDQACSASECNSVDGSAGPILVPPSNKSSQDSQAGKNILDNTPASTVDIHSRVPVQPVARKTFGKSRIQSRTKTPGWSGGAHNLVIRFSDDESGSDSEGHTNKKPADTKSSTIGVVGNRRPPGPLPSKSYNQTTMIASKVAPTPQRSSVSRPFTSSVTKTIGSTSRGAGTLPVEPGSQVKNFNVINKNIAIRERGYDRGVDLSNSKLQDLRQQIALRESELKLKSAQRSKESVPFRDDIATTLHSDTTRKLKSAQIEPKEPEKKRKKVSGSYSPLLNLVGSQEILVGKSVSPSKEPAMHNKTIPVAVTFDCGLDGNSASRTDLSIVKWNNQNEKQVAGVPENITAAGLNYGGNAVTNCIQSDGNTNQMEFSPILNQATCANMNSKAFPKITNNVELDPIKSQQASSPSKKAIPGKELVRDNNRDIFPNSKRLDPAFNNIYQESPNHESLWNCLSNANASEHRSMNMKSLAEMEESLDKDLGEAQEHRRMCEIEERNALKAYRKAQRALVEANVRCTDLYHKREFYSTQLRSFMISNSSLLCSSSQNEKVGIDYSNDASGDMLLIPSNHQLQQDYYGFNPPEIDSNFHYLNPVPIQRPYRQVNGRTAGSELCSEPDASTSEPLSRRGKTAAERFLSPSNCPNVSADEDDETLSNERVAVHHSLDYPSKNNYDDGKKNVDEEPSRKSTIDSPLDSLFLEATLRSELFSRMGAKNSKNSGFSDNIHLTFKQRTENDTSNGKTQANLGSFPLSHAEAKSGPDIHEKSNAEAPMETQHGCLIANDCLNFPVLVDSGVNQLSNKEGSRILLSEILTFNIFRSAFSHFKIISLNTLMEWLSRNRQNYCCDIYSKVGASIGFDKMDWSNSKPDSACESIIEVCRSNVGSYACDIVVDPLWPLCMYELRGKCNNDECPWQHARDNGTIISHDRPVDSDSDAKVPRQCDIVVSPTYLVGLDALRADHPLYESVIAWRNGQGWQTCFSLSLTLSNLFQKDLPLHGPLSSCSDGRLEVHGSWSRQSSYFLSRSDRLNQLKQSTVDSEQALEMAILVFNQEADKQEGLKKALPVLSRALEVDPTSITLWMFYLLIYHMNMKSVVTDDMFSYAVKYNEESYELWLMYINSRLHLNDHLVTYDEALRSLCLHASTSDLDEMHSSACILDLFLQMIDCLCMSGNVENAIQKIIAFSSAVKNSLSPPMLLSDVYLCLNISDKCIFWVCCAYLVIYKKLPDAIVRQFECQKQLPEIEWTSILLLDDEKQRAVEVMEQGADSVMSSMETESLKSDSDIRLAHLFSVNHIRCMAALDSLECCTDLLDKYLRLYPSCFELVLISTRSNKQDFGGSSFFGFEKTINSWPRERSGIHCIWNQYAEYVMQNGQKESVKELMDRWFHSVWKVNDLEKGRVHDLNGENKDESLESSSDSIRETSSGEQIDQVFGFLNLSLHKLLQNDRIGAHIEHEKALKAAFPKYLKHCIREHAAFLLTDESLMKENVSINGILNLLKHHVGDAQIFCVPEPLPRKFINKIKKPRVRQLMGNIFSPVSFDFSLVNLVLEVWFGPSLLPEEFNEPKHMVDFVEGILDIWPSNYELALSVCKMLSKGKNSNDVTAPVSMMFWANSNLVSAIFHAVPIPPEHTWVEAARILGKVAGVDDISLTFHRRAVTVYPFSVNLWRSYQILFVKKGGDAKIIPEEAKAKGIDLVKSL